MKKITLFLGIFISFYLLIACNPQTNAEDNQSNEFIENKSNENQINLGENVSNHTEPTESKSTPSSDSPNSQAEIEIPELIISASEKRKFVPITIHHVLLGKKSDYFEQGLDFLEDGDFDSSDFIGEIKISITSNLEERLKIFPSSVLLVINGDQIDLSDWWNKFFATPCGHIYPGVNRVGKIWFNLNSLDIEDSKIELFIKTPYNGESKIQGEDYYFELEISNNSYLRENPQ